MTLINAKERLPINELRIDHDTLYLPMHIFDATIIARIADNRMKGIWKKNYLADYELPFEAEYGPAYRFDTTGATPSVDFSGTWESHFLEDNKDDLAIGIFHQNGKKATGTFLTPTGDYRFLDGVVIGDSLKLSTFDGEHAYLFTAKMKADGTIDGDYWAGKSWHQKWTAFKNPSAGLPDPNTMTHLKKGHDQFEFKFPNVDGDLVELSDPDYQDKVIVVEILGTWCPNCMDETKFLADWYKKNNRRGVEVIGLAFERKPQFDYASERIQKVKDKLGVEYKILIAGTNNQESQAKALPMLDKIKAFPTTIILDKNHRVREIHTGFSGPGTGEYYEKFIADFNHLIDKLVAE